MFAEWKTPLLTLTMLCSGALAAPVQSQPYHWKSVQIVGAGFVDGIVFHPTTKDVRFARTDMGGAYRWDTDTKRWAPMLDWVPYRDLNFMGVESIAVDPTNADKVYLACGTYTNATTPTGAILRSLDGGHTFKISRVPIKFGGNENGRGNGERLSVDPSAPNRLLLGTRHDGLWHSEDSGQHWTRVTTFPATGSLPGAGVVVTLFDTRQGNKTEYAAVSTLTGPTLYSSSDQGETWSPIPDAPQHLLPTHMVESSNGVIWITYGSSPGPSRMSDGSVWRFQDGAWTEVTPEKPGPDKRFGYAAVSLQRDRPNIAIVSSFGRPGGEQIFRTVNSGSTWVPIIGGKETYDDRKAPYISHTGIHWLFDIEIDPRNPNHAMFTTGYGGHETFNLTDADRKKPVKWQPFATGIEESVALQLLSPTSGAHLVTAIGDYGGFVHLNLDRPVPAGNFINPHFGNTSGIASGSIAPNVLVRVGSASGNSRAGNIGYSLDFGKTWQTTKPAPPNAREGHIAVSADAKVWIWSVRGGSFRTTDIGQTWTPVDGLPAQLRTVADANDANLFYALSLREQKLYFSKDGGLTFAAQPITLTPGLKEILDRGDNRGGQDQIYSSPGNPGRLWIAAFDGLHRSADGGKSFARCPSVEVVHAFGFGKSAPHRAFPTLYLVGTIAGQRGIFRSDDDGKNWLRINDDAHQWGLVLQITGDPRIYGRVYVGTHGRGVFYGDP